MCEFIEDDIVCGEILMKFRKICQNHFDMTDKCNRCQKRRNEENKSNCSTCLEIAKIKKQEKQAQQNKCKYIHLDGRACTFISKDDNYCGKHIKYKDIDPNKLNKMNECSRCHVRIGESGRCEGCRSETNEYMKIKRENEKVENEKVENEKVENEKPEIIIIEKKGCCWKIKDKACCKKEHRKS
jgi:hypothetical protein